MLTRYVTYSDITFGFTFVLVTLNHRSTIRPTQNSKLEEKSDAPYQNLLVLIMAQDWY